MKLRILLCILFLLSGNIMMGQTYNQLGFDINGADIDNFGSAVSSSADGDIIAIGGPNSSKGYVKVFVLQSSQWVERDLLLGDPSAGSEFGFAVSISEDGQYLAVGDPSFQLTAGDVFTAGGKVYVYKWDGSNYNEVFNNTATAAEERYGASVSLSSTGNLLAVGANAANGGGNMRGLVRVFESSNDIYTKIGSDILGVADNSFFGVNVDIKSSASGERVLAIAASNFNSGTGQVSVYRNAEVSTITWANPIIIDGSSTSDQFGSALSLSANGERLVIGAPQDFLGLTPGYINIYEYNTTNTSYEILGNVNGDGQSITSNTTADLFGAAVALSGDGSHVLVGAPADIAKGIVGLYKLESDSWNIIRTFEGAADGDKFGVAVTLDQDGSHVVVGANLQAGQAQVYELFVPDVTAPTVTLSSSSGAITNTNPVSITITFSEEVTAFDVADITVANATVSNLNTTDNIVYTADITASQDGDYTVSIDANSLTDIAGNGNEASNALAFTLDTQSPTAQVTSMVTNNKRPVITGTVNDANAIVKITIPGTSVSLLTATNNGTTWELAAGSISSDLPDGTYNVVINAEDLAGNAVTLTSEGALTIDATAPTIMVEQLLTTNAQPSINGTVSDALSGVASVEVLINGITTVATIADNNNWNASISTDLAEGTYDVTVTALDFAGNQTTLTETNLVTIDLTAPTVAIQGLPTEIGLVSVPITFAFSEAVTAFEASDVTLSNATLSDFTIIDGRMVTANITAQGDSEKGATVSISIAANTFEDLAGAANEEAATVSAVLNFKYSGGSGEPEDPYVITSEADLRLLSASAEDWSKDFKQTSNIEMSDAEFTPIANLTTNYTIGSAVKLFNGSYDGNNHYIKNLHIGVNTNAHYVALFGIATAASITKLSLIEIDYSTNKRDAQMAGLVGITTGGLVIENCSVTGKMESTSANSMAGLLVIGLLGPNSIENCFTDIDFEVNGDIKAYEQLTYAGLVMALTGTIKNSYSLSNFNINTTAAQTVNIGGLVTFCYDNTTIENAYYSGRINYTQKSIDNIGALIGGGTVPTFNKVFWDKDITSINNPVGDQVERTFPNTIGYSTFEIKLGAKFKELAWDISAKADYNEISTWKYDFLGNPYLNWQDDNFKEFTVQGKVVDENGNPFLGATVELSKQEGSTKFSETVNTDGQGGFRVTSPTVGFHSITVQPNNSNYETTYFGDTKAPLFTRQIHYDRTVTIRMVPKVAPAGLDGAGRVKGNVVRANGATRMLKGRMLTGEPLAGILISLLNVADNEILITVETDEKGEYEIAGIPAGQYQLLLNMPGLDVNLEGSTFSMDEKGTPLVISAAVSEEGVVFNVEEDVLGIKDQIKVAVYPNPIRDFVNIEAAGQNSLKLMNINGQVEKELDFVDMIKLDVSELTENVYILQIQSAKGMAIRKLIRR